MEDKKIGPGREPGTRENTRTKLPHDYTQKPAIITSTHAFASGVGVSQNKALTQITLEAFRQCVDNPARSAKKDAPFFMVSSLPTRAIDKQKVKGMFSAITGDIDKNPIGIDGVVEIVEKLCPGGDYEIYTTASATEANQKLRIVVFLDKTMSFQDWLPAQRKFNDLLADHSLEPDRVTERANQIFFLPNAGGEIYKKAYRRDNKFLDPNAFLAGPVDDCSDLIGDDEPAASPTESDDDLSDLIGDDTPEDNSGVKDYAKALLNSLREAEPGTRNDTLNNTAYLLFGLVKGKQLDYGQVHSALHSAALQIGLEPGEITATMESAWRGAEPDTNDYSPPDDSDLPMLDPVDDANSLLFDKFILNGTSSKMEAQMLDDKFVLPGIALRGQATTIYAKPNAGKTLLTIYLLIEAIKAGEINGQNVFYINADDNHKGLVQKTKIAEQSGFKMLAPDHEGFKSKDFLKMLQQATEEGQAPNIILILDTLKKFTELMDKRVASGFMRVVRSFISKGGTLIMLAHVNKNRDQNGKAVAGGTSDIKDDCDCVYILDIVNDTPSKYLVKFTKDKARGNVVEEVSYSYAKSPGSYQKLLESVRPETQASTNKTPDLREVIASHIQAGTCTKVELIKSVMAETGVARRTVIKTLDIHTGDEWLNGDRWTYEIGDRNARFYKLIDEELPDIGDL
ncbi:MAG: hypothetical protein NMNS01_23350 [Nitrosomonas sp.]|nr:MAG: hypothetical protein NMNS01_23350 [Nitrosomonas sp.]